MVTNTRKILNTTTADQHDRVLLQVVALTRDVARDFDPVREPDARDFSQRRVRLLRCLREDPDTDAALLRAVLQGWTLRLADDLLASGPNQLTDSRHTFPISPFRIESRVIPTPGPEAIRQWRMSTELNDQMTNSQRINAASLSLQA